MRIPNQVTNPSDWEEFANLDRYINTQKKLEQFAEDIGLEIIGDLVEVTFDATALQRNLENALEERATTGKSLKEIKKKILDAVGRATRRQARLNITLRRKGDYPSGSDMRVGGLRMSDTIQWKTNEEKGTVTISAGRYRADASILDAPENEPMTWGQGKVMIFYNWAYQKPMKITANGITRQGGIYFLSGAFKHVVGDLQRIVDKELDKIE